VSKTVWIILTMGVITILALTMGMVVTLGQFQEVPAVEWVKVAQAISEQFKFENVNARVMFRGDAPSALKISYTTKPSTSFDSSAQNVEMENVAKFAIENYKGKDLTKIDQVEISRSEIHGRGCFQTTYLATFTLPNPKLRTPGDQFRQR
jgi:hypothetical protein